MSKYIKVDDLQRYCDNQKDHSITPNEFQRMTQYDFGWQTGTPSEEGYYLCWVVFPEIICEDAEGSWKCMWKDGKWYDNQYEGKLRIIEDLGAKVIAWQKITPYEEKENGHTD